MIIALSKAVCNDNMISDSLGRKALQKYAHDFSFRFHEHIGYLHDRRFGLYNVPSAKLIMVPLFVLLCSQSA